MTEDCKESFQRIFDRINQVEESTEKAFKTEGMSDIKDRLAKLEAHVAYLKAWSDLHDDHHFKRECQIFNNNNGISQTKGGTIDKHVE